MSTARKWTIGCGIAVVGSLCFCGLISLNGPGGAQFFTVAGIALTILVIALYLQSSGAKQRQQTQIAAMTQSLEAEVQHTQTDTPNPTAQAIRFIATEKLTIKQEEELWTTHTILGSHPETMDDFVIPDQERYSGMYVLGVQGVGKSSLLECLVFQDINKDTSVIVIDPHGDLIDHIIGQMPDENLAKTIVLDIEDTDYPFGLNLFSIQEGATTTQQQQAHDRVLHIFEKCFPETSHMLLDKYIGNIAPVFFANASAGYSVTDIPRFLRDDTFRQRLLTSKKVGYFIRSFWQDEYTQLSPSKRQTETRAVAFSE